MSAIVMKLKEPQGQSLISSALDC